MKTYLLFKDGDFPGSHVKVVGLLKRCQVSQTQVRLVRRTRFRGAVKKVMAQLRKQNLIQVRWSVCLLWVHGEAVGMAWDGLTWHIRWMWMWMYFPSTFFLEINFRLWWLWLIMCRNIIIWIYLGSFVSCHLVSYPRGPEVCRHGVKCLFHDDSIAVPPIMFLVPSSRKD